MGFGALGAGWRLVRTACDVVTLLGLASLGYLLALEHLPSLLSVIVRQIAPEIRLEVAEARLHGYERLELRDVRVRAGDDPQPLLAAKRMTVRAWPSGLRRGHIDEVELIGPVVTLPPTLPALGAAGGAESGAGWSIGRLVTRDGRFSMPPRGDLPGAEFGFAFDLRDVGADPERAERAHRVHLHDVTLTTADGAPLLAVRRALVQATIASLVAQRRIEEVRLASPVVSLSGTLPPLGGGVDEARPPWTLGRLVVRDGRFRMPPSAALPGVTFRVAADLRDLGTSAEQAERTHRVTVREVAVTLAGGAPLLAVDAARAEFRVAGLLAKRVDELGLMSPLVTVPETLPAPGTPGSAAPSAGWTLGRLVTLDGRLLMPPSGDLPGISSVFAFDLRELGTDPERAARAHRVRLRDLRAAFAGRPPSTVLAVVDAEFTIAGLLERHQLALLRIERGTLVLDRPMRDRLTGAGTGAARATPARDWSIAVLDIGELGIRLSDLGPQIPDITLRIRTRLTDVALAPGALARARTPQRVELSDLTLDSPLDPFRPVVHVGSIFVEFTLADIVHRQIASIAVVSPTIYLGEDLIWYMDATRSEAAAAPREQPWTVRSLRADLGKIVLTLNGVDRVGLPLNFRTDARNVVLGDLATLRLAAALEVPRQNYLFPGFDLELVAVEGELRFDYPPGTAEDNVVNTLEVAEIRWRDYRIRDGWLSATFDEQGVSGKLGGQAYQGYVDGGVSIPFGSARVMSGWASCTDLDLAPLSATVAGQYVEMTGLADFEGAVELLGNRVDRATGKLTLDRPGVLNVPGLDAVLQKLPATAPRWQRDLLRIAVETFRDYPYTSGGGELRFADHRGEAHLGLDGERGKRQFDIYYYEDAPLVTGTAQTGE